MTHPISFKAAPQSHNNRSIFCIQSRTTLQHYLSNWLSNNNLFQIRELSYSSGHDAQNVDSGRGDTRRRTGPKLNEFGHNYTQIGGSINLSACKLNEVQINNLIRGRMQCRLRRSFNQADKIQEELTQSGVFIDDKAKVWRADGQPIGPSTLNEFGHDYTQIGGPIDPSVCKLNEVQINNLIRGRMQSRRIRNFNQADKIWEELTQNGVEIRDDTKVWRADGIKSFPMHATSTNNAKSTNKIPRMVDCNTFDEAIQAIYNNLDKVSPRDLSAFWTVVPKLLKYRQNRGHLAPQLEAIFNKTTEQIRNYGPRDLAATALAFAKTIEILTVGERRSGSKGNYHVFLHNTLVGKRDIIFQFIAKTAVPILPQFEPRHLANLTYTFALLGYVPQLEDGGSALFDHIAEKSIPLLGKFTPQGLANIVWSFEKLNQAHPTLFEKVGDHISSLNHLNDFKPQDFSNILLACSKAELAHPRLFDKVGNHIALLNNLDAFKSQALANTVWGYAKAGVSHPELFEKVGDHIILLNHLNDFKPQHLSNIVWSYAKAGVSNPELFQKVGHHIATLNHLNDFGPQHLSNTVWAYATAEVSHPRLLQTVGDHIVTCNHLNVFKPQDLSNIVWAYATAGVLYLSHPEVFDKLGDHIVALDNLDGFTEQGILNLVWGLNEADVHNPQLYDKLAVAAIERKEEFGIRSMTNLVRWTGDDIPDDE